MIDLVTDLPPNVVEKALRQHDRLRLLYVLGERFDGYSPGAAWEDTKLGIGHWSAWERIAVVTDRGWIRDAVRAVAWMLPGEVRVFPLARRDVARDWVAAAD